MSGIGFLKNYWITNFGVLKRPTIVTSSLTHTHMEQKLIIVSLIIIVNSIPAKRVLLATEKNFYIIFALWN